MLSGSLYFGEPGCNGLAGDQEQQLGREQRRAVIAGIRAHGVKISHKATPLKRATEEDEEF